MGTQELVKRIKKAKKKLMKMRRGSPQFIAQERRIKRWEAQLDAEGQNTDDGRN